MCFWEILWKHIFPEHIWEAPETTKTNPFSMNAMLKNYKKNDSDYKKMIQINFLIIQEFKSAIAFVFSYVKQVKTLFLWLK